MDKRRVCVVGLGVMGANLALRLADTCADLFEGPLGLFDSDPGTRSRVANGAEFRQRSLLPADELSLALGAGNAQRVIFLMVPAGAVDTALSELRGLLGRGDVLVECGNSHFEESERRNSDMNAAGTGFVGLGVSGGALGARNGPSLMAGAAPEPLATVRPFLERIAANFEQQPCLFECQKPGAGHFVKMVHNGIEYVLMQAIAETVQALRTQGLSHAAIAGLLRSWNDRWFGAYLLEITASILETPDPQSGQPILESIVPRAGHKGTGLWAAETALRMGVPTPLLLAAVTARLQSGSWQGTAGLTHQRTTGESAGARTSLDLNEALTSEAYHSLRLCWANAFAEGGRMILAARSLDYEISLPAVAAAWRAGCIIRCDYLNTMQKDWQVKTNGTDLAKARSLLARCLQANIPMPILLATMGAPLHSEGSHQPGIELIQAQRDYFGQHGFARHDEPGTHHGPWHKQ